jgi:hypothetical protein
MNVWDFLILDSMYREEDNARWDLGGKLTFFFSSQDKNDRRICQPEAIFYISS